MDEGTHRQIIEAQVELWRTISAMRAALDGENIAEGIAGIPEGIGFYRAPDSPLSVEETRQMLQASVDKAAQERRLNFATDERYEPVWDKLAQRARDWADQHHSADDWTEKLRYDLDGWIDWESRKPPPGKPNYIVKGGNGKLPKGYGSIYHTNGKPVMLPKGFTALDTSPSPVEWLHPDPALIDPMSEPLIRLPNWTKKQWLILAGFTYSTVTLIFAIMAIIASIGMTDNSPYPWPFYVFLIMIGVPCSGVLGWFVGMILRDLWRDAGKK